MTNLKSTTGKLLIIEKVSLEYLPSKSISTAAFLENFSTVAHLL
jgi:hypothetical protein